MVPGWHRNVVAQFFRYSSFLVFGKKNKKKNFFFIWYMKCHRGKKGLLVYPFKWLPAFSRCLISPYSICIFYFILTGRDLVWSNVEQVLILHGFCSALNLQQLYFNNYHSSWVLCYVRYFKKNHCSKAKNATVIPFWELTSVSQTKWLYFLL